MSTGGDTPVETAVKIATMELAIFQLGKDVEEIKDGNKEIFKVLNSLNQHHIETNGIINLINDNQKRSDSRWHDLKVERDLYIRDLDKWRAEVDKVNDQQAGAIKVVGWLLGIVLAGIVTGVAMWLVK
jgi:hypothetical protein